MTTAEDYMKRYEENQQMFADLMNTPSKDIVEGLKKHLAHDKNCMMVLENNPAVTKLYKNDVPTEIHLYFHSGIEINIFAVYHKSENSSYRTVLTLTKDFKL